MCYSPVCYSCDCTTVRQKNKMTDNFPCLASARRLSLSTSPSRRLRQDFGADPSLTHGASKRQRLSPLLLLTLWFILATAAPGPNHASRPCTCKPPELGTLVPREGRNTCKSNDVATSYSLTGTSPCGAPGALNITRAREDPRLTALLRNAQNLGISEACANRANSPAGPQLGRLTLTYRDTRHESAERWTERAVKPAFLRRTPNLAAICNLTVETVEIAPHNGNASHPCRTVLCPCRYSYPWPWEQVTSTTQRCMVGTTRSLAPCLSIPAPPTPPWPNLWPLCMAAACRMLYALDCRVLLTLGCVAVRY